MISEFQGCLIIFALYIVTVILHYWLLNLEDNSRSPILQKILSFVVLATGFFSIPLTLPTFVFTFLHVDRAIRKEDRKSSELESEIINLRAENRNLRERLGPHGKTDL